MVYCTSSLLYSSSDIIHGYLRTKLCKISVNWLCIKEQLCPVSAFPCSEFIYGRDKSTSFSGRVLYMLCIPEAHLFRAAEGLSLDLYRLSPLPLPCHSYPEYREKEDYREKAQKIIPERFNKTSLRILPRMSFLFSKTLMFRYACKITNIRHRNTLSASNIGSM